MKKLFVLMTLITSVFTATASDNEQGTPPGLAQIKAEEMVERWNEEHAKKLEDMSQQIIQQGQQINELNNQNHELKEQLTQTNAFAEKILHKINGE